MGEITGRGLTRDDSQPLREWVADIPRVRAWVAAQVVCPDCGGALDNPGGCFRSVSSVWCQNRRRHSTPPKTAPARESS